MYVNFVKGLSVTPPALTFIEELTPEKSLMSVNFATKDSVQNPISDCIDEITCEEKLPKCALCEKAYKM